MAGNGDNDGHDDRWMKGRIRKGNMVLNVVNDEDDGNDEIIAGDDLFTKSFQELEELARKYGRNEEEELDWLTITIAKRLEQYLSGCDQKPEKVRECTMEKKVKEKDYAYFSELGKRKRSNRALKIVERNPGVQKEGDKDVDEDEDDYEEEEKRNRKNNNRVKRKSHEKSEEEEGKEKEKKKKIVKRVNFEQLGLRPPFTLPPELRAQIERDGGTDIKLVIMKQVWKTDLTPHHDRFSIPLNQIIDHSFLTDNEKHRISIPNISTYVKLVVEPYSPQRVRSICLKKWKMKRTESYVLSTSWNEVVRSNKGMLKEGAIVQLWSYRINGNLHFVLIKVHEGESSSNGGSSSDHGDGDGSGDSG